MSDGMGLAVRQLEKRNSRMGSHSGKAPCMHTWLHANMCGPALIYSPDHVTPSRAVPELWDEPGMSLVAYHMPHMHQQHVRSSPGLQHWGHQPVNVLKALHSCRQLCFQAASRLAAIGVPELFQKPCQTLAGRLYRLQSCLHGLLHDMEVKVEPCGCSMPDSIHCMLVLSAAHLLCWPAQVAVERVVNVLAIWRLDL